MLQGTELRADLFDEFGRERLQKKGTALTPEIMQVALAQAERHGQLHDETTASAVTPMRDARCDLRADNRYGVQVHGLPPSGRD